jgi:tetratricopeptide (TPR) repeat protein
MCLSKFKNNEFKEALYEFRTILDQFPEDLNAHFYGGLCYYNIGKYDLAIESFNFVVKHYISAFDQEAEWYKAKTLLNMDKVDDAKEIMESIVEKNGFYSDLAKKQLKKI